MNVALERDLDILWSDFVDLGYGIEQKIEAIERIGKIATTDDLPRLIAALKSEKNDFWIRELLAQPICDLDDGSYFPELFEAFEKNFEERYDNDGFSSSLIGLAESRPHECWRKLNELLSSPDFKHREHAKWLMEFCSPAEK